MPARATRIFGFLERTDAWSIERREIACVEFSRLRRSIRGLVVALQEQPEIDTELSGRLGRALAECLTVPMPFDAFDAAALDAFGDPEFTDQRWGVDVASFLETARSAMEELRAIESPLRQDVETVLRELVASGSDLRIYCHRSAATHFATILENTSYDGDPRHIFLHSARDYRICEPFDVLVKVGPLRLRGWGSAPGAILNAPRFRTLMQILWVGGQDDPLFGYDPVIGTRGAEQSVADGHAVPVVPADGDEFIRRGSTSWHRHLTRCGADTIDVGSTSESDELTLFESSRRIGDGRPALLVAFAGDRAAAYPPHAEVLLAHAGEQPDRLLRRRTLADVRPNERVFLVLPDLGELDFGGIHASEGRYSRIWKQRLQEQMALDSEGLMRRLRDAGITLVHLRSCIEHWSGPSTRVIHAPRHRRHFETLLGVLDLAGEPTGSRIPWPRLAWREIGASRGEAIQLGMQEHEIIDEELERTLGHSLTEVDQNIRRGGSFRIELPTEGSIEGTVWFLEVLAIESGFRVPEALLRAIIPTARAEEWRV